jgi:hypothetical protein
MSIATRSGRLFLAARTALAVLAVLALPAVMSAQAVVVSGDPGALIVSTAAAGLEPDAFHDATTTYAVTTSAPHQKITARLDAPLPAGVTLTIQLTPPPGATSRGAVALTTLDQELVGPIPTPGSYAGLAIVYAYSATVKAGPIPGTARVVVLSVVPGP